MTALRDLPAVDALLGDPRLARWPAHLRTWAVRRALDDVRAAIRAGAQAEIPDIAALAAVALTDLLGGHVRPVINATGVVLHTNLGRAPWAPEAVAAAVAATGWATVELDVHTGERGGRARGVVELLRLLTGAESALIVNNCAAAVLLGLTALARDREVVVSRGQLVEIGGSFRVPDVVASGGARLVEVGTTNRTRAADYAAAIGPDTAALLVFHPSNFRIVGFTGAPSRAELAALARSRGLLLLEDLGSGSLTGDHGEPAVRDAVAAGVDAVFFSGDKLLGGPQAGVIVGRSAVIDRMARHPLYRALRVDKVTLAALEATLALHAQERPVPVATLLDAPLAVLKERAAALAAALAAAGVPCEVRDGESVAGGGSLPGEGLPTALVAVPAPRLDDLARALRTGDPAVVARLGGDRLLLDVRTVRDADVAALVQRVAEPLFGGY